MGQIKVMNKKPLSCSVAISTFNGERFIIEQLDSIMNQTVLPDEIIISDDNSSDNTVLLIKMFMEKNNEKGVRIDLVINDRLEKGVNQNLENAIKNTTCDIVLLCDQDDIWCRNKVECVLKTFYDNPEMDLLVHDAKYLIQNENAEFQLKDLRFYDYQSRAIGEFIGEKSTLCLERKMFINKVLSGNIINGMCMAIRRDYIFSILPFPKAHYFDWWILVCSIINDSVYALNEVLAYYRIHSNNLVGMDIGNTIKKRKNYIQKARVFLKNSEKYIIADYIWSKCVLERLNKNFDCIDISIIDCYFFLLKQRVNLIKLNKVYAIKQLYSAYKRYKYSIYNKTMIIHDIAFVLLHGKKYRKRFSKRING